MGRVTLQTIADLVGVSRMTVSNAFSRPDQLSGELRDRILTTAAELGYAGPDPAARRLVRGTAGAVGILLTDTLSVAFDDEITARFLGGVAAELGPLGLALTLLTSIDEGEEIPARDVPLDGAIVYSCDDTSMAVDWLVKRRLPLVFVDRPPRLGHDSVNIEDREGAKKAAKHLIELSHRRIGILTAAMGQPTGIIDDPLLTVGNPVAHDRIAGWLDGLGAAAADAVVVQAGDFHEAAGRFGTEILLGLDEPPTAILCVSDRAAFGAVEVARERGLVVPDDLSIVGYDGGQLAARMQPALTTVRQHAEAKGRTAAAALLARMDDPDGEPRRVRLPVELIIGASTAPPAA